MIAFFYELKKNKPQGGGSWLFIWHPDAES